MSFALGLLALVFIGRTADGRGGLFAVVIDILLVAGCAWSANVAIRAPAEFSLDERGLTVADGKRFVPWEDVEEIRVSHYQAEHYLTLKLKPDTDPCPRKFITTNKTNPHEVEISLDHLAVGWQELVLRVESASGLHVRAFKDGPFRLRSTPLSGD